MRPDEVQAAGRGAALLLALFDLTDRQRYVVLQRHVRGRGPAAIADELGVTRQAINQAEMHGLARLRARLNHLEEDVAA